MADNNSAPYAFVSSSDDQSTRCGYYILCGGHLERFKPPFTEKDLDGRVELSSADLVALIKKPVHKEGLLARCDNLYALRLRNPVDRGKMPGSAEAEELGKHLTALASSLGINGK